MTKSSTEAEIVAASKAGSELLGLSNFLFFQTNVQQLPTLYQDNVSCMKILLNGLKSSNRTRHLDIQFFWLADYVEKGLIKVEWVNSNDMVADVLTKPLQGEAFARARDKLLGIC